ncbi:MAG: hypothetical protein A3K03_10360 [Bdellovibrionales bacterium RIFOXYD1_FULL_44_7]|nr:MAG: hypothetical protein A3K03_10360 [Bdellovibrionales bacterium RIFOXYD1_FULL_44_7]
MLSEELLRKVKLIELTTRRVVNDVMTGQYRSHFKGHGVQFSEHRLYVPGDDIRHIDWKVTARTKEPLIKKYDEERELTVFLVVDVSGSTSFGSSKKLKSEISAEIAGMLAYAAVHTGDKVGLMLFAGDIELIIPPKKGRQHILRIIRDVLVYKPRTKGTNLNRALEAANRIMKHCGIIFVISDFIADNYEIPLKKLSRRHDVVAINVGDEREGKIPEVGQILVLDPETGQERLINTESYSFKNWLKDYSTAKTTDTQTAVRASRVEQLEVFTEENYGDAVVRFFRARSHSKRR